MADSTPEVRESTGKFAKAEAAVRQFATPPIGRYVALCGCRLRAGTVSEVVDQIKREGVDFELRWKAGPGRLPHHAAAHGRLLLLQVPQRVGPLADLASQEIPRRWTGAAYRPLRPARA